MKKYKQFNEISSSDHLKLIENEYLNLVEKGCDLLGIDLITHINVDKSCSITELYFKHCKFQESKKLQFFDKLSSDEFIPLCVQITECKFNVSNFFYCFLL